MINGIDGDFTGSARLNVLLNTLDEWRVPPGFRLRVSRVGSSTEIEAVELTLDALRRAHGYIPREGQGYWRLVDAPGKQGYTAEFPVDLRDSYNFVGQDMHDERGFAQAVVDRGIRMIKSNSP
ncbi:MAG TPA: hypothetical protein VF584_05060 [Longimicrobium sp.]|jgi:hypothetical protein